MSTRSKIQSIIDAANGSKAIGRMLQRWDRTIGLTIGDSVFRIVVAEGSAVLSDSSFRPPDIFFQLSEETLDLLASRQITPLADKLRGLIRTSGNIVDILRFSSILSASVQELAKQQAQVPYGDPQPGD